MLYYKAVRFSYIRLKIKSYKFNPILRRILKLLERTRY